MRRLPGVQSQGVAVTVLKGGQIRDLPRSCRSGWFHDIPKEKGDTLAEGRRPIVGGMVSLSQKMDLPGTIHYL